MFNKPIIKIRDDCDYFVIKEGYGVCSKEKKSVGRY